MKIYEFFREKQKLTAQEKKDARRKKAQKVERHRF